MDKLYDQHLSFRKCSAIFQFYVQCKGIKYSLTYRNRAIISRSQLVAAPLRNHAKKPFLCVIYVLISRHKIFYLTNRRG